MHREEILLVCSDNDKAKKIINIVNEHFRVIISSHENAITTFEKNPQISTIIYDLSEQTRKHYTTFYSYAQSLIFIHILVLTNDTFLKTHKAQDTHNIFLSIDNLDEEAFLVRLLEVTKNQLTTLERMRIVEKMFATSPVGIAIIYNDNIAHSFVNRAFEEIIGHTRDEYIQAGWNSITHPEDRYVDEDARRMIEERNENHFNVEKRVIKKDGSIVWVSQYTTIFNKKPDGTFIRFVIITPIDNHKFIEEKLKESDRSRSTLLQNLPGLAYLCANDEYWTMEFVSDGATQLTGYKPDEFIANRILSYNEIIVRKYRKPLRDEWDKVIAERGILQFEYEIVTKDGTTKWVYERGVPIFDSDGNVLSLEGIIIDVTHTKKLEKQLQYFNDFNHKLKLPNREFLVRKIQTKLDNNNVQGTIILVNLKDTQKLYRTHGYQYVELLTTSLVNKLKTLENAHRVLYYAEEDIYVFYAKYKLKKDELCDIHDEIKDAIGRTITREQIKCNIGVSYLSRTSTYAENCILRARVASEYRRDDMHGITMHIYDDNLELQVKREEDLKRELIDICYQSGFGALRLVFQPIVDLQSGKIKSFEALARYESPIHGHIPPSEFIPIVEKNRLIIAFGKKIIDLAIIFIKRLISLGINDCPVAINISTLQLLDGAFTTDLISRIERAGIPFNLVVVELTETIFTANYDQLNRALSELTNAGIGTAIDDFGTGFSSLARIEKLDFDTVKIDRSFIEPLTTKEAIEQSTIPEIISICKKFNIRSLAEGIETKDQYDLLKSLGCILGQGYYMSRPLETDAAVNYVLTDKKK